MSLELEINLTQSNSQQGPIESCFLFLAETAATMAIFFTTYVCTTESYGCSCNSSNLQIVVFDKKLTSKTFAFFFLYTRCLSGP